MENRNQWYRLLPQIDYLMKDERMILAVQNYGKTVVCEKTREILEQIRLRIPQMKEISEVEEEVNGLIEAILQRLKQQDKRSFRRVLNATGVILHTNLGRAPLPAELLLHVTDKLQGYTNLEYNLEEGKRGERYAHFEQLICQITGAEAALVVNNNAAAVLLMMSAIGKNREIIVSRGEQIEIGGKFRVPDIMIQSGCHQVEVGTTNKTRIDDYEEAITPDTAALLKVHTSNFRIQGFTEAVQRKELVELGQKYEIPVLEDLGSGVLIDLSKYGLRKEPTVMDSLKAGVDLVTFSGDKLLGGPQSGILVGKKKWIDLCKKHPMTRAVRIDKFTAAMLEEIFSCYLDEAHALQRIPVLTMLTAKKELLWERAVKLQSLLCARHKEFLRYEKEQQETNATEGSGEYYQVSVVDCESVAGGGSLPGVVFQSAGVRIWKDNMHINTLEKRLRRLALPLIVRIEHGGILLDMRTITEEELPDVQAALEQALFCEYTQCDV